MRAPTDAGPASWPLRVFRPWLVATVFGLALGMLLLSVAPRSSWDEYEYLQSMPRAAVYDARDEGPARGDPSPAAAVTGALEELGAPVSPASDLNTLSSALEREVAP